MRRKKQSLAPVVRALEEARYGPQGLLNLRESMPTEQEAMTRAEAWLRERQVMGIQEAVIVTGRGLGSPGGIPVVREGVRKVLNVLKRRGVIDGFDENGPGSFTVKVAPLRRLFDAPRRKKETAGSNPQASARQKHSTLAALEPESLSALRQLAELSLFSLGVQLSERFVSDEMSRQFSLLAASIPSGRDRERLLRDALLRAIEEYQNS